MGDGEAAESYRPRGFRAAGVRSGVKPSGGLDLAVFASAGPCSAAGTYTRNLIYAAPVAWDRARTPASSIRGVVINSGNANAATGDVGLSHARRTAQTAARLLGGDADEYLVASTGVIGRILPIEKLEAGLAVACSELSDEAASFDAAAQAILTTDTHTKMVSRRVTLSGREITLLGIAKGAAMIGPNMATMLGFLFTDAPVAAQDLDELLHAAVETSFNCISVEGHMSTNDTVLLLANGAAGGAPLSGRDLDEFAGVVNSACAELARMIPDDGEGATHLITIDVTGCRTRQDARTIARSVADSALVKTAIHGADPNWGRIVSAAGYAGVSFGTGPTLHVNDILLFADGSPVPFDEAAAAQSIRAQRETRIRLDFSEGSAAIRFWTCDLTAEYVRLNADYTT